jgi:putative polyhydroxyalkanoate system protein
MPELLISQAHTLGLPKARKIAQDWIAQAQADWGMACEFRPGLLEDEILFSRSGAKGSLLVRADSFELRAQLGFLLGSFQAQIEAQIRGNLQALLDQHSDQA